MLTQTELLKRAPSIFTSEPYDKVSENYKMIRTYDVVDALVDEGFVVTHAQQSNVRAVDRRPYAKHMLRFRRADAYQPTGEHKFFERGTEPIVPEAVVWNSHGYPSSAYHVDCGVFSFICANGCIIKQADFGGFRVLHKGNDVIEQVINSVKYVTDQIERISGVVNSWRTLYLTDYEQLHLAEGILKARYGDLKRSPILPETLLQTRRDVDRESNTLWTKFNVMQENVMKGGQNSGLRGEKRLRTTRAIRGTNETIRFNQEAWQVAADLYDRITNVKRESSEIIEIA